ncbi:LacI family transcriptional regulator [Ktedonobacter sp. SOSP1-52]|uniref:LacI family DNA-binding transcriptional regulator n=1 Tax=Ktedonobacter sp. SOSP1-52 TaxID=2778366 RepID=UPI001915424B|nr:LacI family DNA-binding transcriptional regulator [Ktedonobacter sp. SOSP1-52]GHO71227.1 LacI family transcriptional regulator [Ktedonobacter sp. SOSP1-52]
MADSTQHSQFKKPVTIREVAQLARVSMATVSRVLNGSTTVDPQLAERVQSAMQMLNYEPNRAARALAGSRSALLGLLVSDIQNPYFIDLMRGVEEVSQENGYLLVICNTTEDPQKEAQYMKILAAESVAGAIIVPSRERLDALAILQGHNIPIVTVDRRVRDSSVDAVLVNNALAAKEAIAHLIGNGYRRIGIITGPGSVTTANERLLGYRQALQEAGIAYDDSLKYRGPFREETGERGIQRLLQVNPPIDAVLTANNRITVGALRALHASQKRVPADIAVVGFDEVRWAIPDLISITTVTQPAYELGRTAALRLLQNLRQPNLSRQEIVLQHQLLVRASSQAHPVRDILTDPT